jgi:hypothetical protein
VNRVCARACMCASVQWISDTGALVCYYTAMSARRARSLLHNYAIRGPRRCLRVYPSHVAVPREPLSLRECKQRG